MSLLGPIPGLQAGIYRPWQAALASELFAPIGRRAVTFYIDPLGGAGMQWFCRKYLSDNTLVQYFNVYYGCRSQIRLDIDPVCRVFLFYCGAGQMQFLPYGLILAIKRNLGDPHIVVFGFEFPDYDVMVPDRYDIRELSFIIPPDD